MSFLEFSSRPALSLDYNLDRGETPAGFDSTGSAGSFELKANGSPHACHNFRT